MFKTMIFGLTVAASFPALASESRIVRYDDIDLSSPAGLEKLDHRIDIAARSICGNGNFRASLAELADRRACVMDVKARAAQQVALLDKPASRGG